VCFDCLGGFSTVGCDLLYSLEEITDFLEGFSATGDCLGVFLVGVFLGDFFGVAFGESLTTSWRVLVSAVDSWDCLIFLFFFLFFFFFFCIWVLRHDSAHFSNFSFICLFCWRMILFLDHLSSLLEYCPSSSQLILHLIESERSTSIKLWSIPLGNTES